MRLHALALAGLAAAAAGVEREAARVVAAHARLGRVREQPADRVPEADVGGGAGARRLADRRLVDFEHAADVLPAPRDLGSRERSALRCAAASPTRCARLAYSTSRASVHLPLPDTPVTHDSRAEREAHADILQVVQGRADDLRAPACLAIDRARRMQRMPAAAREELPGDRTGCRIRSAAEPCATTWPPRLAGAGPEVDHVLGAADGVFVVLDHHQRVAFGLELLQRVEQMRLSRGCRPMVGSSRI